MSKEFNNLIYIIENAKSIIKSSIEQIQDLILNDKSLQSISTRIQNKLFGAEKKNFKIWLKTDKDYEFTLEASALSKNEIQIIYFRIDQNLNITDFNYEYEFEDMNKIAYEIIEILKKHYK